MVISPIPSPLIVAYRRVVSSSVTPSSVIELMGGLDLGSPIRASPSLATPRPITLSHTRGSSAPIISSPLMPISPKRITIA